jgi:hypothetical protein
VEQEMPLGMGQVTALPTQFPSQETNARNKYDLGQRRQKQLRETCLKEITGTPFLCKRESELKL